MRFSESLMSTTIIFTGVKQSPDMPPLEGTAQTFIRLSRSPAIAVRAAYPEPWNFASKCYRGGARDT
jgi:hypothetical protein